MSGGGGAELTSQGCPCSALCTLSHPSLSEVEDFTNPTQGSEPGRVVSFVREVLLQDNTDSYPECVAVEFLKGFVCVVESKRRCPGARVGTPFQGSQEQVHFCLWSYSSSLKDHFYCCKVLSYPFPPVKLARWVLSLSHRQVPNWSAASPWFTRLAELKLEPSLLSPSLLL